MSYTKIAVRGAATVFIISIIAAFLGYLARFIMARNLTVEQFGLFYAIFGFLALISIFKTLGFDKCLIKFIPEFYSQKKLNFIKSSIIYVSIIQLITNAFVIVIIYLLSGFLAMHFFRVEQADIILKYMAIAFFIDSFTAILKFSFQGFKKMFLFSLVDLIRMLLIVITLLIGFKKGFGIQSPVIAYILAPLILIIFFGWILVKYVFPKWSKTSFIKDKNLLKKLSKYSLFIVLTGSGAILVLYTDTILLTFFTGVAAVGLYNVAAPTAKILTYFPTALGSVLLPITSELWTKKKNVLVEEGIGLLYKYSMIITLPLVLIMVSFPDLILLVLFGKQYVPAANALKILSIGTIFITLHTININFFSGIGKPEIHSRMIYIAATFNLIANLILIPILGIIGAALATATSFFIMMVIGLTKIKKFIKIKLPLEIWAKTLLIGAIFTIVIWLLKKFIFFNVWAETIIILTISGIIYIILLFLFKIITITELRDLYKRILK